MSSTFERQVFRFGRSILNCHYYMLLLHQIDGKHLTGWRYLEIREHRKKVDYAEFMDRVSGMYMDAEKVRVVQDNLNTHNAVSFYERFDPEKAGNLKNHLEFHYTTKKGSWLNMAEIELFVLSRQCFDLRIGDTEALKRKAKAWEKKRKSKESQGALAFHH